MQSTATQACGAGAQSQKILKWWSWSLKFEFPFNWHIWYSKPIIQWVLLLIDQIVLEPERKSLDAWSRSPKFEFRRHSPCSNHCEPCPWLLSASFWSRLQIGKLQSYSISTGLVRVKTIAVFIMHVQYLVETYSATYFVGNFSSNTTLKFPHASEKFNQYKYHKTS